MIAKFVDSEATMDQIRESLIEEMAQIHKNNDDLHFELVIL